MAIITESMCLHSLPLAILDLEWNEIGDWHLICVKLGGGREGGGEGKIKDSFC
jgi:hypothetical protein